MERAARHTVLGLAARGLAALGLAVLAQASPAAQADGAGLQARITLGGQELSCRDFRGQLVRSIQLDEFGDVAHARIVSRIPIITLNKRRLDTLPDKLQVFFFHHECAHHMMGHVFHPTQSSENEADCYAIKLARREGSLSRAEVEGFAPYLAASRGSAFGHLPGPVRAQRLLACFDDPSEENYAEPAGFATPPSASVLAGGAR